MKRLWGAAALVLMTAPVLAADVGVAVTVDKPGFYGSVEIGNMRPAVVNVQPVVVQPVVGVVQPVYMHVPPGHAKNWKKYCGSYGACGRPVYFVKEEWYQQSYLPARHGKHAHKASGHDKGHGKGKGKGHD